MNSLTDHTPKTKLKSPPAYRAPAGRLAALLLDPQWGLTQATQVPSLQELCDAMGHYYAGLDAMEAPSQALSGLLPMLLRDCEDELRERHAAMAEFKVLLAARLIWTCPKQGARGVKVAEQAWWRAWGRKADAAQALAGLGR